VGVGVGVMEPTFGADLVALEVEPGVVETGWSSHHHVDIDGHLQARISGAGQVDQEGLDLLRHQTLVRNTQRGRAQCLLVGVVLDTDGIRQLQEGGVVNHRRFGDGEVTKLTG